MKLNTILLSLAFIIMPLSLMSLDIGSSQADIKVKTVTWKEGGNVEKFWKKYARSKGGLTWSKSETFPEYKKVKEGDTFLALMKQGPCLMEFYHSRWRRANDVRRWDNSMNDYGGCPYVFD